LDRPAANDIVVGYSVSGTAAAGDFAPLSGTATILAGQTTATISVTPVDDAWKRPRQSSPHRLAPVAAITINAAAKRDFGDRR
jgi:hypothetical protein